jgi:hypothetical protein
MGEEKTNEEKQRKKFLGRREGGGSNPPKQMLQDVFCEQALSKLQIIEKNKIFHPRISIIQLSLNEQYLI